VRSIRRTRSCFPGSEHAAIRANVAWANGKLGDPGVTVAIIDSGIDYDDPDASGLVI
jgi:subtilisin family serine protease